MGFFASVFDALVFIDQHKVFLGMAVGWAYRIFSQKAVLEWFGFEVIE